MEFEKYIKENLSDQRSEIDASKIWDKVSMEIEPKKDKRRGFIFWTFGISLLVLLLICTITFTDVFKGEKSLAVAESAHVANNKTNIVSEPQPESRNTSELIIEKTPRTETISLSETKVEKPKEIKTESKSNSDKSKSLKSTSVNNNQPLAPRSSISKASSKTTVSTVSTPSNNTNATKPIYLNTSRNSSSTATTQKNVSTPLNNDAVTLKNAYSVMTVSQITPLKILPLNYQRLLKLMAMEPLVKKVEKESTNRFFSVALLAGGGITNKHITSVDTMYGTLRATTETALEHYNVGINVDYHLNQNWAIGTGLDYLSQTERFKWEGDYQERQNGTYVDTVYFSTQQDSTITTFTGEYTATIRRNMIKYNQYQFINIPLHVQYSFKLRNHRFSLQPGILINLVYNVQGDYLNNFGAPDRLENLLSSTSIQYQLGFDYHKRLTESVDFAIGTSVRWAPHTSLGENAVKTESAYRFQNCRIGFIKKL